MRVSEIGLLGLGLGLLPVQCVCRATSEEAARVV